MTTGMFKGVTADVRREERRRRLREGCLDLVGEVGLAGATLNGICAQAGLTKRYFYESYTGRDELLVELLGELFDGIRDGIVTAVSGTPNAVAGRSRATAVVLLDCFDRDPRLARLYVESPSEPPLHRRRDKAIAEFAELLALHVVQLDLDRPEVRFASTVVVSGTTDIVSRWLSGNSEWTRDSIATSIERLGATLSQL